MTKEYDVQSPIDMIRESISEFKNSVEQAMDEFHEKTGMHVIKIEFSVSFSNNNIDKVKIRDIKLEPIVMNTFYND